MGFKTVQSGEGYTKFSKGANLYITPDQFSTDEDEYQGNRYQQLVCRFDAVPESGGERGRVPAWLSSKITIRESDEHTSALGKFLVAAGILDDVLKELGADESMIQDVKAGDERFEAESPDENKALLEAIGKHLDEDVVLRVGSKWNKDEEYSMVKDFYERVEENPFADDPSEHVVDDTESDSESDDDSDADSEEALIA